MDELSNFKERIKGLKVLILGDVMLDHYIHGTTDRISPEAPVPIVALQQSEHRLGGAANVALNVAALGATPLLCGAVGKDVSANQFFQLLEAQGLATDGIFSSDSRPTTKKTRILANRQQLLRVDEESTAELSLTEEEKAIERIGELITRHQPAVILFQDYNKGFLTARLIEQCIALAKDKAIPVVVDPKFKNFKAYRSVDLFKPNLKELREGLGKLVSVDEEELKAAAQELAAAIDAKAILITLSEHGVYSFTKGQGNLIPTYPREIIDVCGAGDAVIAVCALALATGLDFNTIGRMANLAGGLVCESLGVVPIHFEKFMSELSTLSLLKPSN